MSPLPGGRSGVSQSPHRLQARRHGGSNPRSSPSGPSSCAFPSRTAGDPTRLRRPASIQPCRSFGSSTFAQKHLLDHGTGSETAVFSPDVWPPLYAAIEPPLVLHSPIASLEERRPGHGAGQVHRRDPKCVFPLSLSWPRVPFAPLCLWRRRSRQHRVGVIVARRDRSHGWVELVRVRSGLGCSARLPGRASLRAPPVPQSRPSRLLLASRPVS